MSHDARLDQILAGLLKQATRLTPSRNDQAIPASCEPKFGGMPYAESGDTWPRCPSCEATLPFVAQFRADGALFTFFYCFDCFPWGLTDETTGEWIVRRYPNPDMTRLVEISPGDDHDDLVSACAVDQETVRVLPDWEGIDSANASVSPLCNQINSDGPWEAYEAGLSRAEALDDYATLVGGYPRFVQNEATPTCTECGERMQFLAQIDSEDEADLMWGDVGLVYLFECPGHPQHFVLELQCH